MYVFPRFVVLPEHAPKGFVPYVRTFDADAPAPAPASSDPLPPSSTGTSDGPPPLSTDGRHVLLQGLVTAIEPHVVRYVAPAPTYAVSDDGTPLAAGPTGTADAGGVTEHELSFDYLVYAAGASLPAPCDVWGDSRANGRAPEPTRGSKTAGVEWMRAHHEAVAAAGSVAVIGGGALGVQFASDVKDRWPHKVVTLVHSRRRLLPLYPEEMHEAVMQRLEALGVRVILGERVVEWPDDGDDKGEGMGKGEGPKEGGKDRRRRIRTSGGTLVEADLVLACTGQRPRVALLRHLANVDPVSGRIRVRGSLQIEPLVVAEDEAAAEAGAEANGEAEVEAKGEPAAVAKAEAAGEDGARGTPNGHPTDADLTAKLNTMHIDHPLSHIYAIGDCAHTAAIQAGHTAYYMGEVAARNIVRDIRAREGEPPEEPETYTPGPPAIKLTLGLRDYATSTDGTVTTGDDGAADLQARLMWAPLNAGELPDDA